VPECDSLDAEMKNPAGKPAGFFVWREFAGVVPQLDTRG
jgi:hypothetical protein